MLNSECDDEPVEVVFIGTSSTPQLERLANTNSNHLVIVESHDYGQYEQDNYADEFN